jgi:hypothetical protein
MQVLDNTINAGYGEGGISFAGITVSSAPMVGVVQNDLYLDGNTINGNVFEVKFWYSTGADKEMSCNNVVNAPSKVLVEFSTYDGPFDHDANGVNDCAGAPGVPEFPYAGAAFVAVIASGLFVWIRKK